MTFATRTIHTLVGTSKTGKSYLLKHILSNMLERKEFKFGLVFTATKFTDSYSWLPDERVYANFDMDAFQLWLRFLVKIKKARGDIPPSFLVFDDIISQLPLGSKEWAQFIATFRHFNITIFITTQFPNMIDPLLRSQTEYAYLFTMTNDPQFRSSYLAFGGLLPNLRAWREYVNKHTGDYKCIIFHRDAPPTLAERYKQYKAPPEGKKRLKFDF